MKKIIGKYTVIVDVSKCVGDGACVEFAPGVFKLTEDQIATIISQEGNDDETKLLAAQVCPVKAIVVIDTATGQQVWPLV